MNITKGIAPVKGIGKPDYSKEISASKQRAGIYLKYAEQLKTFALIATDLVSHPYPVTWVKDRIAVGGTARFYDVATGVVTPFTIPQGYTATIVQTACGGDQDLTVALYFDSALVNLPITIMEGGSPIERNLVVPYSSKTFDPTGATSHQVDAIVINRGGGALSGGFTINALLEKVGTPPLPTTKDCQCPFCGHIQTVETGTTVIACGNCGKTYYVQDLSSIREL